MISFPLEISPRFPSMINIFLVTEILHSAIQLVNANVNCHIPIFFLAVADLISIVANWENYQWRRERSVAIVRTKRNKNIDLPIKLRALLRLTVWISQGKAFSSDRDRQRRGRDDNYSVNRLDHAGGRRLRSSTRLSIEQQSAKKKKTECRW